MTVDSGVRWCVAQQRRRLVAEYIENRRWVTVRELAERFDVSEATARRDLDELAKSQQVVRVHGGAGAARW
ncbi:MAG: DeoR family transcriptional regulator [Acidothermaceae bacterium]